MPVFAALISLESSHRVDEKAFQSEDCNNKEGNISEDVEKSGHWLNVGRVVPDNDVGKSSIFEHLLKYSFLGGRCFKPLKGRAPILKTSAGQF
jgi:hypothetical protein